MIDLSICILTFNHKEMLCDCLDSIYKNSLQLSIEIIIVDSGSSDGTIQMLEEEFPNIKLIRNSKFPGFASSNNKAFEYTSGRYIMILNDDTKVLEDSFRKMVTYMDTNPKTGAIGPKLLNSDLSLQYSSYLSFPSLKTELLTKTIQISWLRDKFRNNAKSNRDQLDQYGMRNGDQNNPRFVKHLMGACIMVRKEILVSVGNLDDQFYLSLEDQDWCKRIGDADWDVVYLPESQVIHYGNQSVKQISNFGKIYLQSRCYFQKKHYGYFTFILLKSLIIIIALNNAVLTGIFSLFSFNPERREYYGAASWQNIKTIQWLIFNHKSQNL
ncbi:MAG TPA: glycosyltransferase family 2 protein [Bacteroidales bacterium]|nr:glycosyltransferase family 2 protein [Bacteroidales bacterium]